MGVGKLVMANPDSLLCCGISDGEIKMFNDTGTWLTRSSSWSSASSIECPRATCLTIFSLVSAV